MQEASLFEQFIIKCCEMDEWDLRSFLAERLKEAGFYIQEDNYSSYRSGRYQEVHNMLAIRGEQPKVCLVAHTDVCRDHNSNFRTHKKAIPVIKTLKQYGKEIRIIQDKNCKVQVGGDDRLGVAIGTWIALNTGYDLGMLYTTDEEAGGQSADCVNFEEIGDFELLCQIDRGNRSNQLVTRIGGVQLCDNKTADRLLKIAMNIGLPRMPVVGFYTDVATIKGNGKCKNAVNMTCGYHASIGSSPDEYISIQEANETLQFVNAIIRNYEMETIEQINSQIETFSSNSVDETDETDNNDDDIIEDWMQASLTAEEIELLGTIYQNNKDVWN